jgi:hypothetical protein
MTARQRRFAALLGAAALPLAGVPASAAAALRVRATGWTATLVNAEQVRTGPHGTVRLCQAIPVTALAVRLRYAGARPGARLTLRVRAPGHETRLRRVRLPRRSGTVTRGFTPAGLRLRSGAFGEGRLVLRATHGGRRLATASVRFEGQGLC